MGGAPRWHNRSHWSAWNRFPAEALQIFEIWTACVGLEVAEESQPLNCHRLQHLMPLAQYADSANGSILGHNANRQSNYSLLQYLFEIGDRKIQAP
jgi:hypothetical protein